jgi:hypothetical protein
LVDLAKRIAHPVHGSTVVKAQNTGAADGLDVAIPQDVQDPA